MSFTKGGQIKPELLKERDERLGKSSADVAEARKDLQPSNPVAAAADHWEVSSALATRSQTSPCCPMLHAHKWLLVQVTRSLALQWQMYVAP